MGDEGNQVGGPAPQRRVLVKGRVEVAEGAGRGLYHQVNPPGAVQDLGGLQGEVSQPSSRVHVKWVSVRVNHR